MDNTGYPAAVMTGIPRCAQCGEYHTGPCQMVVPAGYVTIPPWTFQPAPGYVPPVPPSLEQKIDELKAAIDRLSAELAKRK